MCAHTPSCIEKVSLPWRHSRTKEIADALCMSSCMYGLIKVAVKRVHSSRPGSELLGLDVLLAATNAAKSFLQRRAHALANGVAASNTRSFCIDRLGRNIFGPLVMTNALAVVSTGAHLGTRFTKCLMVFQGLLNGVGRLTLALEIVRVVVLSNVSKTITSILRMQDIPFPASACSRPRAHAEDRLPLHN
jgi:hypothetical protein